VLHEFLHGRRFLTITAWFETFLTILPHTISLGAFGERIICEAFMKKIALALVLVITSLSLGGCFVGKGKNPPVTTRG
jgi:hypothetical protein